MKHIKQQLESRGIGLNPEILANLATRCNGSVALLLMDLGKVQNDTSEYYTKRKVSNGDNVILIVRKRYPVTVMYRRSEQPFTPEVLKVDAVCDIREIIKTYKLKDKNDSK